MSLLKTGFAVTFQDTGIAALGQKSAKIKRPALWCVFQKDQRRPKRFRRIPEKRFQNQVLRALDIELDGIDPLESFFGHDAEQGFRSDPDLFGQGIGIDNADRAFAAIFGIDEERDLTILIGHGTGDGLDRRKWVLLYIVDEPLENLGLRLDRQDSRAGTGLGCDKKTIAADARPDIDKAEMRGDPRPQQIELGGIEILRRE